MKIKNFSDWAVAMTVVVCSAILFGALAAALSGFHFGGEGRTIRANFHNVTGVNTSANVKYAGALAGKVASIRMLSPQERIASGDPQNAVQIVLALNPTVPPLPSDIKVSVAADTLLSDKFVLIDEGTPTNPVLADNATLQGITPVTFDKLARDLDGTLESVNSVLGGTKGQTGPVFDRLHALLNDTQDLINQAKPVIANAQVLTSQASQLITGNKDQINQAITNLNQAGATLGQLAKRTDSLVADNKKTLTDIINSFKITADNLQVTSTYTRFLTQSLAQKPSQLLWGTNPPPVLPSPQQILRSKKPIN